MSLDKAIFFGKEHRKPWYDARAFDPTCRNHGNDTYYTQKVLQSELRRKRLITELKYKEGMIEPEIRNGHLVFPVSWRDDDDNDDTYDKE